MLLSVVDFGRGIAEPDQARVFEKFRTVRRSPSHETGSDTGLGLPFCKLAVERMGGRIALTSLADVTTTFTVALPALAVPEHAAPP
jgi:signal transduction histidine kinase